MLNYTNNNDTSVISLFFVSFLITIFFPENLVRLIFTFKIWRRQFVVDLQQLSLSITRTGRKQGSHRCQSLC